MPKTATTTLQDEVFAKHTEVRYLGKRYRAATPSAGAPLLDHRLPGEAMRMVRERDLVSYPAEQVGRVVSATLVNGGPDHAKVTLLSEEGLASAYGADRMVIAQRLRALFGPCDILITIRNQLTGVPSLYLHHLRKGVRLAGSFDVWLREALLSQRYPGASDDWMLRTHKYFELYRIYREIFPEGRIRVLLYEDLVREPSQFALQLSDFLGIDAKQTLELLNAAPRLNVGASPLFARIAGQMKVHRLYPVGSSQERSPLLSRTAGVAIKAAVSALQKTRLIQELPLMSPAARDLLWRYYAEDNARLADACNLPLTNGYPL